MYTLTIDTGTTNTRVCLWKDDSLLATEERAAGVRDTSIEGNNRKIKAALKSCIAMLLDSQNIPLSNVQCILASGMITSGLGLMEVAHLTMPAGTKELSENIAVQSFPEICAQPIHFIPGLKYFPSTEAFDSTDIMRGEEVEAIASHQHLKLAQDYILVLPGSHTKFVAISKDGTINSCCTTMAGEMLSVVTHNTILSETLEHSFTKEIDKDFLMRGAIACQFHGLNRALFLIRVMSLNEKTTQNQLANFLLGVIVSSDIQTLKASPSLAYHTNQPIVIVGKGILAQAFHCLLTQEQIHDAASILVLEESSHLAGQGCMLIAKQANLLS